MFFLLVKESNSSEGTVPVSLEHGLLSGALYWSESEYSSASVQQLLSAPTHRKTPTLPSSSLIAPAEPDPHSCTQYMENNTVTDRVGAGKLVNFRIKSS